MNQDLMLAAGKNFENLSIFIGFGALFQQSGNKFCKMHPQAPPKTRLRGCTRPQHPRGSMPAPKLEFYNLIKNEFAPEKYPYRVTIVGIEATLDLELVATTCTLNVRDMKLLCCHGKTDGVYTASITWV